MICFHKGVGYLSHPIPEVMKETYKPFWAFGTEFNRKGPGVYVSSNTKRFEGIFRITLKHPDIIIVENSLHKHLHGGFNVFDLPYNEFQEGLVTLYEQLNVCNVEKVKIYRPEFECAIQVADPEMVYNSLLTLKNKKLSDMEHSGLIYGKYIRTDAYKLKFYSKYLQMKKDAKSLNEFLSLYPDQEPYLKNTLRIEMQIYKNRHIGLNRPLEIKDLLEKEFMLRTYDKFISACSNIQVESLPPNIDVNSTDLIAYAILTHPNQRLKKLFQSNNNHQYNYLKKRYRTLQPAYLSPNELKACMQAKKELLFI